MDPSDLHASLTALLQTLGGAYRVAPGLPQSGDELFRAYLNAFWLRPETAVVQTLQARALAPLLASRPVPGFCDLGCGDGIHTSLLFGWRFAEEFDAFQALNLEAADVFDAPPAPGFRAEIAREGMPVPLGLDLKLSSVARAGRLGSFASVLQCDAARLPLRDGSLALIHSNALANLGDPAMDAALRECARVLAPGGSLLLASASSSYPEALYYGPRLRSAGADRELARLQRLDGGRSRGLLRPWSEADWARRLASAGLRFELGTPCVPPEVLGFWDTGLRPYLRDLVRWTRGIADRRAFLELKRASIEVLERLLLPLLEAPLERAGTFLIVAARKP